MKKSKKPIVLHVLKSSIYSGAERVAITIIKSLQQEYELVYVATDGEIRSRLEQEQIPMELLSKFNRNSVQRVIAKYQPDIIHAHDFSATVLCASISGNFRLISHLHYDPPWVKKWNLKTLVYQCCDSKISQVITVSQMAFDEMVFAEKFRKKQVTLENMIDGEQIRKLSDQIPNGERLADKEIMFCDLIFVGRFVEQKNPQRFIELIRKLKLKFPEIQAWLLGDGELLGECKKLVHEFQLEQNITFENFQDNPYYYMKRAKILCVTSRWEGFGLVSAEASLLGIPVLTTRNSGALEVFGEDAPEFCITDDEFIQKIERLLNDSVEWDIWSQRSRKRAEKFESEVQYRFSLKEIYRNEDSN